MIKQIVDEIKAVEAEAAAIRAKARDEGSELIRKAQKQADHIKSGIHKERRQIIQTKVDEAEKNAKRKEKVILNEAEEDADRVEREANKFFEDAVNTVFERVLEYGN